MVAEECTLRTNQQRRIVAHTIELLFAGRKEAKTAFFGTSSCATFASSVELTVVFAHVLVLRVGSGAGAPRVVAEKQNRRRRRSLAVSLST